MQQEASCVLFIKNFMRFKCYVDLKVSLLILFTIGLNWTLCPVRDVRQFSGHILPGRRTFNAFKVPSFFSKWRLKKWLGFKIFFSFDGVQVHNKKAAGSLKPILVSGPVWVGHSNAHSGKAIFYDMQKILQLPMLSPHSKKKVAN